MTMYNSANISLDKTFVQSPDGLNAEPDEGALTFDDIPLWCTAYFEGDVWWVSDKGEYLVPDDGRHLELWSQTTNDPGAYVVHEDYINGWLRARRVIHFNVWEVTEVEVAEP